jgi:hypothetical protein
VVSEQKVLTWLRHDVLRKNPSMGYENILQHIKAVVHLWRIQRSVGFNKEENPRNGALLAGFLQKMKRGRARQRKDLFLDKGVDSLIDGYQSRDLPRISGYFFNQNTTDGLRNRLDFFLGHAILGRSEDKRNAMLSDLYLYEMEEEGPSECQAIVLNLFKGKTNQEGKTQIGAAIRHKDVRICPVGALAFYLFGRFHVSHEPFPNMASRQQWYNVCLFRGKGTSPITYRQQHRAIEACYQALQILSSKKTHSMRGAGTVLH